MSLTLDGQISVATKLVGGSTDLTGKEGYACILSGDEIILASAVTATPCFALTKGSAVGANAAISMGVCQVWISEATTAIGQGLRAHTDGTWQLADASSDEMTAIALEVTAINSFCRAFVYGQAIVTA